MAQERAFAVLPTGLLFLFMVIGERRLLVFGQRVFFQLLNGHLHGFLELWVVAFPDQGRVIIDFDVGGHAVVFDIPLLRQVIEREVGCGDETAVD
jgi:hypothetical protein